MIARLAVSLALALALASAPLLAGCGGVTELRVSLDVDASLLARERVLEVIAFDDEGREIYRSEQLVGGASEVPLPAGVRVVARSDSRGVALRFVLRAGASDAVVRRDLWLAFEPGEIRELDVRLDAACADVSCGAQTTCACTEPGCGSPECVAYGPCEAPASCGSGATQRCVLGGYAPACTTEEDR